MDSLPCLVWSQRKQITVYTSMHLELSSLWSMWMTLCWLVIWKVSSQWRRSWIFLLRCQILVLSPVFYDLQLLKIRMDFFNHRCCMLRRFFDSLSAPPDTLLILHSVLVQSLHKNVEFFTPSMIPLFIEDSLIRSFTWCCLPGQTSHMQWEQSLSSPAFPASIILQPSFTSLGSVEDLHTCNCTLWGVPHLKSFPRRATPHLP